MIQFIKREIADAVWAGSRLFLISAAGAIGVVASFAIIPTAILYGLGIPITRAIMRVRGAGYYAGQGAGYYAGRCASATMIT